VEYQLCEAKSADSLQRTVNQLLGAGWRPTGGVAVVQSDQSYHWWYYQAVVRDSVGTDPTSIEVVESVKPRVKGFGDFD